MEMSGFVYICSGGETFDSIARELWQDENYAADLLCANPETCMTQVFSGGERIQVPVVSIPEHIDNDDTINEPVTAPWKE